MPARSFVVLCVLFLTGCTSDRSPEPFAKLAEEFIYSSLANSPSSATQVGYHRHGDLQLDSMLDDYSPAELERQRRWYQDLRVRFERASDAASLGPEDRADLAIIHDQISLSLLELQSIQEYRHNPTLYVELVGNALYGPFILEYADKNTRYQHIIARMKQVPRLLEQARRNLASAPEIWTQVAVDENLGNIALIDAQMRSAAPEALRQEYDDAASPALAALRAFTEYLQADLAKRGYDWRLGPDKYTQQFQYGIATNQTPDAVLKDAESQMDLTRREMYRIAMDLNGGRPEPGGMGPTVKHVLAGCGKTRLNHVTPEMF